MNFFKRLLNSISKNGQVPEEEDKDCEDTDECEGIDMSEELSMEACSEELQEVRKKNKEAIEELERSVKDRQTSMDKLTTIVNVKASEIKEYLEKGEHAPVQFKVKKG